MTRAAILGVASLTLSEAERALFRAHPPAGFILFARNIESPAQVAGLTASLRAAAGSDAVVLIDQEGGRVARLRPPHWRAHPAAGAIGSLPAPFDARAAWITGALIGADCAAIGIDVVCAPNLDLRVEGQNEAVVGDRAFSDEADVVARLGRAMAAGLLAAGVQPVGKHCPGHGRALVDSHHALPVVEGASRDDLLPFERNADLPWMMTAHIRYLVWDTERPATLSRGILSRIVRRRIGFDGVLVSDDLAMRALSGSPGALAAACLAAGCDLAMYCAGDTAGNEAVLRGVGPVAQAAEARLERGRALAASSRQGLDVEALAAERDAILAGST